eukprot:CAMPEP_0198462586 /NCGR_PEP_ID=MMETSP1456-20131121/1057_1 /TAXON_ID=1461544 ORGANISM="Unidentified sp., Strain RCC1871" /NCGR_SAMPLE_ID=MMETSP1456 /ASSEMBLY_ACC=CAM_ASM_001119 /LENGTH=133 /DNA_ID=CAMNT_0044187817 /DNA_START=33 /DNA_END=430 /DNA_ORIENTATION=-
MEILPGYLWGDDRKKGAVYDGHMLNYAVFQGSVEILKWMEEKYKWEPWPDDRTEWYVGNEQTGFWAGWSGSFKVFEYLKEMGYMLTSDACTGAVMGGAPGTFEVPQRYGHALPLALVLYLGGEGRAPGSFEVV